ncbi:methyl-accepting chemotaxis protein [Blastococcus sp. PRF04-17]|uniref:methyl-accepting chemotaxis protein n=1 Tax=Blastococcus sp. PRF04-17 TaxID=2933797 RepID=UPI001FF67343|nr:methyl-accepting chemotaxis protein [Blastococcus sp. PRF04-17]UOY00625.1 hypothetical protein MVA48_16735 [Blastococcus sp. PRF04-17]
MLALSASIGVLLCVGAAGRIDQLDDSRRALHEGHVVASSDLGAIQATYEAVRHGYTAYSLADVADRGAHEERLASGRAQLEEQLEAYAGRTRHPDRVSTLTDHIGSYFAVRDGGLHSPLDDGNPGVAGAIVTGPLAEVHNAVTQDFIGLRTEIREDADGRARTGGDAAPSARMLVWALLGWSLLSCVATVAVARPVRPAVRRRRGHAHAPADDGVIVGPEVPFVEKTSAPTIEVSEAADEVGPDGPTHAARVAPVVGTTRPPVVRLRHPSTDVAEMVKVVRSITDQTYVRALDAAIEAARTGAVGRDSGGRATTAEQPSAGSARVDENAPRESAATRGGGIAVRAAIEAIPTLEGDGRNRQTAVGTTEISGDTTGVPAAAQATQGSAQTVAAVDDPSRMSADPRTSLGRAA